MNKLRMTLLLISNGLKLILNKLSLNKINISKNIRTKIRKNETENASITIRRNEDCEISENNFVKK